MVVEARSSDSRSSNRRVEASNGMSEISEGSSGTKISARERRLQKDQEEKTRISRMSYSFKNACKDDVELREINGDSLGNPEEMRKRVEERVRKMGRDVLSLLTGSSLPMAVTFKADFDATDSNVWLELYGVSSDKDLETIGSGSTEILVSSRANGWIQLDEHAVDAVAHRCKAYEQHGQSS